MSNRVIRDWTDSEKIDLLSAEGERFFTRLFMKADDFGYYHANPKLLLSTLFPLKEDITKDHILLWLNECEKALLINTYECGGKKYLCIINFGQRLRRMKSSFPQSSVSESLSIVSNKRPETETETETETEIALPKKYFRLRDAIVNESVSDYLKNNYSIFIEEWIINNKEPILDLVYKDLDVKYFAYSFNSQNHILNSFKSTWDKIKKQPINKVFKRKAL